MSMLSRSCLLIAIFGAAVLPNSASLQLADPIPGGIPQGNIRIGLETVAEGLAAPNYGTYAPGLPNYVFVTDQPGILWAINLATGAKSVFLDVSSLLTKRPTA